MSRDFKNDLTVGSIRRHLTFFALPMLAANFLQNLYNVADSIWVGQMVGKAGLAAVAISFPVMMVLIAVIMGLGMASTIMIAQYAGAKDMEKLKRTISTSLAYFAVAGVAVTILGILLSKPLLRLMQTPADVMDIASQYLMIIFGGMLFLFGYNTIGAILRGLGDSKTPMMFTLYATIINIILDPLMIKGIGPFPQMGVAGAAVATVVAQAVAFFGGVYYLRKKQHILDFRLKNIRFHGDIMKLMLKLGLPTSVQQGLMSASFAVMMGFVNSFGTTITAAFGAGSRFDGFAFMPAFALSAAVSAVAGQNIGAYKDKRAMESVKWGAIFVSAINIVVTVLAVIFADSLIRLFTQDPDVIRSGAQYLRIVAWMYVPFGCMIIVGGFIQGAGDTMFSMIVTIASIYLIRLPLAYFLAYHTPLGSAGIYVSIVSSPVIGLVASVIYLFSGKWKNKRVTQARPLEQDATLEDKMKGKAVPSMDEI